jgi:hypothetical protein
MLKTRKEQRKPLRDPHKKRYLEIKHLGKNEKPYKEKDREKKHGAPSTSHRDAAVKRDSCRQ